MAGTVPVDVNCAKKADPKLGVKRLTLTQLFSADLEGDVDICEPQRIHFHVAILITGGSCAHMVDFSPLPLKSCDLLLLRAGQVHAFDRDRAIEGEILKFTPEFIGMFSKMPSVVEPIESFFKAGPRMTLCNESAVFVKKCYEDFSTELALRGAPYADARIAHSFALLVNRLASLDEFIAGNQLPETHESRLARDFSALVETNFLDRRDPEWYSRKLRISTRTLDRQLVNSRKKTCKQLIIDQLVLEAKRLLTDPDLQIKDVAYSLRFEEIANFSRFFHRNAGLSPRDFRIHLPDWPLESPKKI